MASPWASPGDLIRRRLVHEVRSLFNDQARGERPVERSPDAYFTPDSTIWRVHGDVTAMFAGGIAALLLQMLHPLALAGVVGHSTFRADMLGRLRRTARFVAETTYGERTAADAAIARVQAIHARVRGIAPDGRAYSANDSHLLAWIHLAEALCFLAGYVRYVDPAMPRSARDTYFAQFATVARRLGADPVPETLAQASAMLDLYRPELAVDDATREVARLILGRSAGGTDPQSGRPNSGRPNPSHLLLGNAAIGLLPPWARTMLDLDQGPMRAAGTQLGTQALASTLRWAFAGTPGR